MDQFVLKYEVGSIFPTPEKATLKKLSLIRIRNKHRNKSRLLILHTHSLMYKTDGAYEDISKGKEMFDLSN